MPAAEKLRVLSRMALSTILGRQFFRNYETTMVGRILPVLGTMAIEAVDPLSGVPAAFELVDDGRGFAAVTLSTLPVARTRVTVG